MPAFCALFLFPGLLAVQAPTAAVAQETGAPAVQEAPDPLTPGGGREGAPAAQAEILTDSASVGDVIPVEIRVPGSAAVAWPDTLPLRGLEAENAARVRVRMDTLADGSPIRVGSYRIVPWRPGTLALPEMALSVAGDTAELRVALPTLDVASVLPADTAGVEPRAARGVIGPNWDWAALALVALLVAGVLGTLAWWWRRRRARRVPELAVVPSVAPREAALAALDEARDAGLVEAGEWKAFYTRVSEAVRRYAAAVEPVWGEDLTTTELLGRFRRQVGLDEAARLRSVLAPADQVKFARRVPDRDAALEEWEAARGWVATFAWPPPALEEEAA